MKSNSLRNKLFISLAIVSCFFGGVIYGKGLSLPPSDHRTLLLLRGLVYFLAGGLISLYQVIFDLIDLVKKIFELVEDVLTSQKLTIIEIREIIDKKIKEKIPTVEGIFKIFSLLVTIVLTTVAIVVGILLYRG